MGNKGSKEAHKSTKGETRVLDVEAGKLSAEDKRAFVESWQRGGGRKQRNYNKPINPYTELKRIREGKTISKQ